MLSQVMQLAGVFIAYDDDHCYQRDISFLAAEPVQFPKAAQEMSHAGL